MSNDIEYKAWRVHEKDGEYVAPRKPAVWLTCRPTRC